MPRSQPAASIFDAKRAEHLRRWVVILGVFVIIANAAAAAYDQWRSYQTTVADTGRELDNVARILGEQTENSLKTVDVLLRETTDAYRRFGARAPRPEFTDVLAARAERLPQLMAVQIQNADGATIYRSRSDDDAALDAVSRERSYFVAQRDSPNAGVFVSDRIAGADNHAVIVLSRRLSDPAGRFGGVVSGVVDLGAFQNFYRQIKLGAHSSIILARTDGTVVVREPAPATDSKVFPHLATSLSEPATRMVSPIDGIPRFIARSRLDDFPLVIGVGREVSAVLDPWREEVYRVAVRTLALTLAIALALAFIMHQLRRVAAGEHALRESEQRYALAMEGANEGHFDFSIAGDRPFYMSPRHMQLLGLDPEAHIDNRDEALVNVHPLDRPRLDQAYLDHLTGRAPYYYAEYRVRQADGEWHWVQVRGRCLRHPNGDPDRIVGSATDITDRKRADEERTRLEAKLRKSQKMEAMGTLAGGIAHDFNNILGAILGYGELAQKNAPEGSVVRRYIDNVMQAGGRAKALVERILAFSRSGMGERAPVNVEAVVAETVDLICASLPKGVRVMRELEAGDAAVIGDATQLHEVAMNLCTNALQAMPDGGELEVRLERVDVSERRSVLQGELKPGAYVRLTVRDTGKGIEPQVLDRMFDPFFTTKPVGSGTGLGLSLVHGIVTDMNGAIDVASVPGDGTTFCIWLPVAGSAPAPKPESQDALPRGNGETVMVVDDEPMLVALSEEMLAELGYEPVGFESSAAALEAFTERPERFDVVLTDEMMPELTGTALAGKMRRIRSDIPMLIMSGHVESSATTLARSAGVSEILRKPLRRRDIAEALSRMLSV